MRATVVILTKLPGHLPVKTRLQPLLGEQGAIDFHLQALRETILLAHAFDEEPVVATSPFGIDPASVLADLPRARLMPVEGEDGSVCLEHALTASFDGQPLVALGADAPDLPKQRIEQGLDMLKWFDAAIVPTRDGGFSCLVLREPVAGLAEGFTYGGDGAFHSLCTWLDGRGRSVAQLDPWNDVDTPEDYQAYRARREG